MSNEKNRTNGATGRSPSPPRALRTSLTFKHAHDGTQAVTSHRRVRCMIGALELPNIRQLLKKTTKQKRAWILLQKFSLWRDGCIREKEKEARLKQIRDESARNIQRIARGRRGRKRVDYIRWTLDASQQRKLNTSCLMIQCCVRRFLSRARARAKYDVRHFTAQNIAASKIQQRCLVFLSKCRVAIRERKLLIGEIRTWSHGISRRVVDFADFQDLYSQSLLSTALACANVSTHPLKHLPPWRKVWRCRMDIANMRSLAKEKAEQQRTVYLKRVAERRYMTSEDRSSLLHEQFYRAKLLYENSVACNADAKKAQAEWEAKHRKEYDSHNIVGAQQSKKERLLQFQKEEEIRLRNKMIKEQNRISSIEYIRDSREHEMMKFEDSYAKDLIRQEKEMLLHLQHLIGEEKKLFEAKQKEVVYTEYNDDAILGSKSAHKKPSTPAERHNFIVSQLMLLPFSLCELLCQWCNRSCRLAWKEATATDTTVVPVVSINIVNHAPQTSEELCIRPISSSSYYCASSGPSFLQNLVQSLFCKNQWDLIDNDWKAVLHSITAPDFLATVQLMQAERVNKQLKQKQQRQLQPQQQQLTLARNEKQSSSPLKVVSKPKSTLRGYSVVSHAATTTAANGAKNSCPAAAKSTLCPLLQLARLSSSRTYHLLTPPSLLDNSDGLLFPKGLEGSQSRVKEELTSPEPAVDHLAVALDVLAHLTCENSNMINSGSRRDAGSNYVSTSMCEALGVCALRALRNKRQSSFAALVHHRQAFTQTFNALQSLRHTINVTKFDTRSSRQKAQSNAVLLESNLVHHREGIICEGHILYEVVVREVELLAELSFRIPSHGKSVRHDDSSSNNNSSNSNGNGRNDVHSSEDANRYLALLHFVLIDLKEDARAAYLRIEKRDKLANRKSAEAAALGNNNVHPIYQHQNHANSNSLKYSSSAKGGSLKSPQLAGTASATASNAAVIAGAAYSSYSTTTAANNLTVGSFSASASAAGVHLSYAKLSSAVRRTMTREPKTISESYWLDFIEEYAPHSKGCNGGSGGVVSATAPVVVVSADTVTASTEMTGVVGGVGIDIKRRDNSSSTNINATSASKEKKQQPPRRGSRDNNSSGKNNSAPNKSSTKNVNHSISTEALLLLPSPPLISYHHDGRQNFKVILLQLLAEEQEKRKNKKLQRTKSKLAKAKAAEAEANATTAVVSPKDAKSAFVKKTSKSSSKKHLYRGSVGTTDGGGNDSSSGTEASDSGRSGKSLGSRNVISSGRSKRTPRLSSHASNKRHPAEAAYGVLNEENSGGEFEDDSVSYGSDSVGSSSSSWSDDENGNDENGSGYKNTSALSPRSVRRNQIHASAKFGKGSGSFKSSTSSGSISNSNSITNKAGGSVGSMKGMKPIQGGAGCMKEGVSIPLVSPRAGRGTIGGNKSGSSSISSSINTNTNSNTINGDARGQLAATGKKGSVKSFTVSLRGGSDSGTEENISKNSPNIATKRPTRMSAKEAAAVQEKAEKEAHRNHFAVPGFSLYVNMALTDYAHPQTVPRRIADVIGSSSVANANTSAATTGGSASSPHIGQQQHQQSPAIYIDLDFLLWADATCGWVQRVVQWMDKQLIVPWKIEHELLCVNYLNRLSYLATRSAQSSSNSTSSSTNGSSNECSNTFTTTGGSGNGDISTDSLSLNTVATMKHTVRTADIADLFDVLTANASLSILSRDPSLRSGADAATAYVLASGEATAAVNDKSTLVFSALQLDRLFGKHPASIVVKHLQKRKIKQMFIEYCHANASSGQAAGVRSAPTATDHSRQSNSSAPKHTAVPGSKTKNSISTNSSLKVSMAGTTAERNSIHSSSSSSLAVAAAAADQKATAVSTNICLASAAATAAVMKLEIEDAADHLPSVVISHDAVDNTLPSVGSSLYVRLAEPLLHAENTGSDIETSAATQDSSLSSSAKSINALKIPLHAPTSRLSNVARRSTISRLFSESACFAYAFSKEHTELKDLIEMMLNDRMLYAAAETSSLTHEKTEVEIAKTLVDQLQDNVMSSSVAISSLPENAPVNFSLRFVGCIGPQQGTDGTCHSETYHPPPPTTTTTTTYTPPPPPNPAKYIVKVMDTESMTCSFPSWMQPVLRYGAAPPRETFSRWLAAEQQRQKTAERIDKLAATAHKTTANSSHKQYQHYSTKKKNSMHHHRTDTAGRYIQIDKEDRRIDVLARKLAVNLRTALAIRTVATEYALEEHRIKVDCFMMQYEDCFSSLCRADMHSSIHDQWSSMTKTSKSRSETARQIARETAGKQRKNSKTSNNKSSGSNNGFFSGLCMRGAKIDVMIDNTAVLQPYVTNLQCIVRAATAATTTLDATVRSDCHKRRPKERSEEESLVVPPQRMRDNDLNVQVEAIMVKYHLRQVGAKQKSPYSVAMEARVEEARQQAHSLLAITASSPTRRRSSTSSFAPKRKSTSVSVVSALSDSDRPYVGVAGNVGGGGADSNEDDNNNNCCTSLPFQASPPPSSPFPLDSAAALTALRSKVAATIDISSHHRLHSWKTGHRVYLDEKGEHIQKIMTKDEQQSQTASACEIYRNVTFSTAIATVGTSPINSHLTSSDAAYAAAGAFREVYMAGGLCSALVVVRVVEDTVSIPRGRFVTEIVPLVCEEGILSTLASSVGNNIATANIGSRRAVHKDHHHHKHHHNNPDQKSGSVAGPAKIKKTSSQYHKAAKGGLSPAVAAAIAAGNAAAVACTGSATSTAQPAKSSHSKINIVKGQTQNNNRDPTARMALSSTDASDNTNTGEQDHIEADSLHQRNIQEHYPHLRKPLTAEQYRYMCRSFLDASCGYASRRLEEKQRNHDGGAPHKFASSATAGDEKEPVVSMLHTAFVQSWALHRYYDERQSSSIQSVSIKGYGQCSVVNTKAMETEARSSTTIAERDRTVMACIGIGPSIGELILRVQCLVRKYFAWKKVENLKNVKIFKQRESEYSQLYKQSAPLFVPTIGTGAIGAGKLGLIDSTVASEKAAAADYGYFG